MGAGGPQRSRVSRRQLITGSAVSLVVTGVPHDRNSGAAAGGLRSGLERESNVKALAFDVFGTVVDWRSSIVREGQLLASGKGLRVDWGQFADAWRAGYRPAMDRVRSGALPWTTLDALHRLILD